MDAKTLLRERLRAAKATKPPVAAKRKAVQASTGQTRPVQQAPKRPRADSAKTATSAGGVPAGFFDAPRDPKAAAAAPQPGKATQNEPAGTVPAPASSAPPTIASSSDQGGGASVGEVGKGGVAVPEGFFDSREQDAKLRKVALKDEKAEEWARFQAEMQLEEAATAEMIHEDEEQATLERFLRQDDEQRYMLKRVEALREKHAASQQRRKTAPVDKQSGETDLKENSDESELDEEWDELGWRSRGI